jgi:molybdopterin-guanine dinucleotide biosynthesis protein A
MLRPAMDEKRDPIGVVLAGGAGRRIGGDKAAAALAGEPLISYPLAVLREALGEAAVVAKAASELPPLHGIPVWEEPDEPRHPLVGIVHALERAGGRAVLVCAADMPLVEVALVRELAHAEAGGAPAVVPRAGGRLQPLLARYEPAALAPLRAALEAPGGPGPLTELVAALGPRVVELAGERAFLNVNTAEDLVRAAALLDGEA